MFGGGALSVISTTSALLTDHNGRRRRRGHLLALSLIGLLMGLLPPPARADTVAPAASVSAASVSASTSPDSWSLRVPLAPLPKLPSTKLPPLHQAASDELDVRMARLLTLKAASPLDQPELRFLLDGVDAKLVVAIATRLSELRESLSGKNVRRLLERSRKDGRRAIRKAKKKTGKEPAGDWLVFMLARPRPNKTAWRDGVRLFGMLRMLEQRATTTAVRVMLAAYGYFGEIVRIDVQRTLERLGDKAVAALIESKKHKVKRVRRLARRRLDNMGRAIAGEAVAIKDPAILVDVLRAFGRVRDVDASRVLLSYASSERVQLGQAAQAAIAAIGEPGRWHLRDAYQSQTGKRAPRGWSWERTAQELFRLHQQATLRPVNSLLQAGDKALREKNYRAATAAFDEVLRQIPRLPATATMAPAYLGRAQQWLDDDKPAEALAALRKAVMLAPHAPQHEQTVSKIAEIEARLRSSAGQPDRYLLKRAVRIDPANSSAKSLLAAAKADPGTSSTITTRQIGAAVLLFLGLLGSGLLVRRTRPSQEKKRDGEAIDASDGAAPPTSE